MIVAPRIAVNGPAIGVGTQLAIACDLRVAEAGAVFGVSTARIGLAVDPWDGAPARAGRRWRHRAGVGGR